MASQKQLNTGSLAAEITRLKAKVQEQDKQIARLPGENRFLAESNREITTELGEAVVSAKKALKTSQHTN